MTDIDQALDAATAHVDSALDQLFLAASDLRQAAAGLPERPLTPEQMWRYSAMVAALAVAQRALKDALDGRVELTEVDREARQRLAAE